VGHRADRVLRLDDKVLEHCQDHPETKKKKKKYGNLLISIKGGVCTDNKNANSILYQYTRFFVSS